MRSVVLKYGSRLALALLAVLLSTSLRSMEDVGAQGPTPGAWNEVMRTPGGSYGPGAWGRWKYLSNYGYSCPAVVLEVYRPTSGTDAYWWTAAYDDSAWSSTGYVVWNDTWPVWGFNPLPSIGSYAWNGTAPCCGTGYADAYFDPDSTALHRKTFTVDDAYLIDRGRLHVFSDNQAIFYVNGHGVGDTSNIPGSWFRPGGTNVLAVQVSNDCTPNNMMGIQYVLEVYYSDPPSWSGMVVNDDTGTGVGGTAIEFSGAYERCSAPGTYTTQRFGTVTTAADGTYSFVLSPLPACHAAADCCGWRGVHLVERLPWDTLYQPVSASSPPPGSVQSSTHIRYPWQQTGDFSDNDFVLAFIPVSTTLSVDHPYLVLEGPNLPPPAGPLPSQVIRGTYTGPAPLSGRPVDVHVWDGGAWTTYATFTDAVGNYMIDAGWVGDPLFGTTVLGSWQAYAEVTVVGRGMFVTNDVFWRVSWFPVHLSG
jgi:hypothetical protein